MLSPSPGLKMDVACSSEMALSAYKNTWCHNPDHNVKQLLPWKPQNVYSVVCLVHVCVVMVLCEFKFVFSLKIGFNFLFVIIISDYDLFIKIIHCAMLKCIQLKMIS